MINQIVNTSLFPSNQFFSTSVLLHSLATPISTLQLSTDGKHLGQQDLSLIRSTCVQLNHIIKAYLKPENTTFNLFSQSSEIIHHARIRYPKVHLKLNAANNIEVTGNKMWWREMLVCLINNACQASTKNCPVTVSLAQNRQQTTISISDHGRGMNLWQRHLCLLPGVSYFSDGTGIGLSFIKKWTYKNNGKLYMWSRPSVGTRICLVFPRESVEQN